MKALKLIALIVIVSIIASSCAPSGIGCKGNRDMLTAGAGRTKFNK